MKEWKQPQMKELSLKNTEYFALDGGQQDGNYVSNDGRYYTPTYSGSYKNDVPYSTAKPSA